MGNRRAVIVIIMLAVTSIMLGFALKESVKYAPTAGWALGIILFLSSFIFIKNK